MMLRLISLLILFYLLCLPVLAKDLNPQWDKPYCDKTPGMADSYVLALSWLPAFCETYGYEAGHAECLDLKFDDYQANHLILHGLWPNQESCGIHYDYCGVEAKKTHCDYPDLPLLTEVAKELRQLMPSYAFSGCLERHEWYKHGSCQLLSVNDYFTLALRLTREVNHSLFAKYLSQHRGKYVKRSALINEIERSFGKKNKASIFLGCRNGRLVDVYFSLPAVIPFHAKLLDLLDKSVPYPQKIKCPKQIMISNFTVQQLREVA